MGSIVGGAVVGEGAWGAIGFEERLIANIEAQEVVSEGVEFGLLAKDHFIEFFVEFLHMGNEELEVFDALSVVDCHEDGFGSRGVWVADGCSWPAA
ncbi:hypothetical protein VN12_23950 [Pirellula sp. SH-Sr6A]|nr:hypothetical protein [Pirellula sp. SH-Sr6A]AMV35200.1 hypothetical protein VN12_23950 [Pirellula sp. SH-Sr6A]